MQVLYGDVQAAARRYAQAHDLDLVLHYNDAVDARDYWSGANLARKMQAGALMPLYAAPGMDISKEVIAALNADLRKKGPERAVAVGWAESSRPTIRDRFGGPRRLGPPYALRKEGKGPHEAE